MTKVIIKGEKFNSATLGRRARRLGRIAARKLRAAGWEGKNLIIDSYTRCDEAGMPDHLIKVDSGRWGDFGRPTIYNGEFCWKEIKEIECQQNQWKRKR